MITLTTFKCRIDLSFPIESRRAAYSIRVGIAVDAFKLISKVDGEMDGEREIDRKTVLSVVTFPFGARVKL